MKRLFLCAGFVALLLGGPETSHAGVTTETKPCDTGIPGVQCRKIVTRTDYRDDGSGEWLKSSINYQFRSTNGRSCEVQGKLNGAQNMRMTYSTSFPNKSGEWSKPGLIVEQMREGAWSHKTTWSIKCR